MSVSRIRRTAFSILIALSPALVFAQTAAPTDFKSLAYLVVQIISSLTAVIIGLGIVYYLWNIATSIKDGGSAKGWGEFRTQVLWGLFALFVMFSIWGILNLLGNTLFGSDNFNSL